MGLGKPQRFAKFEVAGFICYRNIRELVFKNWDKLKYREAVKWGVENFCAKLPKGTPLRQIWSNKSFGVCGSDVVLALYDGEKKSTRESPLESRVVYIILHRYRDVVMTS